MNKRIIYSMVSIRTIDGILNKFVNVTEFKFNKEHTVLTITGETTHATKTIFYNWNNIVYYHSEETKYA